MAVEYVRRQCSSIIGVTKLQKTFKSIRTTTISKMRPRPPLGYGPQLRLYGQAGMAPMSKSTRMISNMVMIYSL